MKKSTYVIIGIIIILMIAIICVFAFTGNNKKENNTNANTVQNKQNKNEVENKQEYEVMANEIEKEIENTLTNETNENEVENTTSSETFEESPKTAEEKAIDIAKKDWKDDKNVNFTIQGMDGNGNYIVVVSDSETVALAFYTINVANQTFTKKEMN